MELLRLNDDCLLEICKNLNKPDLLSLSRTVCRHLAWNEASKQVETLRCDRLRNICAYVVKRKYSDVTLQAGPVKDRQFLLSFREDVQSLKVIFRFEDVHDTLELVKGVTSRSVKKLEIVHLESDLDLLQWETRPIVPRLRQYLATLHIRFPNVTSILIDYHPEHPMFCNYTGNLRKRFPKLEVATLLGYFEFQDWYQFAEAQNLFRDENGYVFRLEFVEKGMRFLKQFL